MVKTVDRSTEAERAKRLAFVMERAEHDKATLFAEAKEEGIAEGIKQAIIKEGIKEGYEKGKAEFRAERRIWIINLLKLGLEDKQIAEAMQVTEEQVQKIREEAGLD